MEKTHFTSDHDHIYRTGLASILKVDLSEIHSVPLSLLLSVLLLKLPSNVIFTTRCYTQNAVLLRQVDCLSVCLSVTLRYRDHIGWNSFKIISRIVLGVLALCKRQHHVSTPKEIPKNFD